MGVSPGFDRTFPEVLKVIPGRLPKFPLVKASITGTIVCSGSERMITSNWGKDRKLARGRTVAWGPPSRIGMSDSEAFRYSAVLAVHMKLQPSEVKPTTSGQRSSKRRAISL